ncbi:DNA ligase D, 3'-phosphoesterase domain-containing protein [Kwoniella sp. CBS 9459]
MWTLHQLSASRSPARNVRLPALTRNDADLTKDEEGFAFATAAGLGDEMTSPSPRKRRKTNTTSGDIGDTTRASSGGGSPALKIDNDTVGPWGFTQEEVDTFPALRRRNFWCIQRHSATAMHYDLRMQVDGGTVSWAVPKGLIGISKNGESSRMAVETTIHPISYTTYEGADGRGFSAGRKGGTLLWDIGQYAITRPYDDDYSSSEEQAISRRKRRYRSPRTRAGVENPESESDDLDGRHQEDLFRQALYRPLEYGKSRSMHFTLKGGRKGNNTFRERTGKKADVLIENSPLAFILILAASSKTTTVSTSGKIKKTWFLRLPKGIDGYPWDRGGEEGDFWGKSVKSGRSLKEVCAGYIARPNRWKSEEERFKSWFGDDDV